MAWKHQQVSHSWSKSHLNTNLLNQNVSKQRKKSYGEVTEIFVSLAFLALPVDEIIDVLLYSLIYYLWV
jgi:hypothetical protein